MPRTGLLRSAGLVVAAVLGGGAALGGATLAGYGDGGTTTTVVQTAAPPATPVASGRTGGLSVNEIYRRSGPGVVQISARSAPQPQSDFFGNPYQAPAQQALGSGFVIDKAGHIVTNYHVVEGATAVEVGFSNQKTVPATIVGTDPSTDLAVLKVDASARALTPLRLADSDAVEVGDPVVAIGNPFGLERTVTAGIVSALQRAVTAPNGYTIDHVIQTDAPINQGNSGGPLLDARGEVIGVNSQIQTGGSGASGNVGIGFAVPSNTVRTVAGQLIRNGKVERSYIGVNLAEITPDLARLFNLPADSGLVVESVQPASPAARAGLKGGTEDVVVAGKSYRLGGDLIVAAGGERVTSVDELRAVLDEHRPGDSLELELVRDGAKRTVRVTLGRQPTSPGG